MPQSISFTENPRARTLSPRMITLLGILCVLASAVFFYFATAVIRWSQAEVDISSSFFAFARFVLGFFVILAVMGIRKRGPAPVRYDLLIGRAVYNMIAVFCFYQAVALTSLAEGNILNMTYPIFLAVISWFVLKEQRDGISLLMVGVAFVGIWLILAPADIRPDILNLWGLASGVTAALAILYLNMSRQYHDTETILFYMFGLGGILMYLFDPSRIYWPTPREAYYLLICSLFGIGGQYLLTLGFRYVTAVEGSIISSSRILMAAILGPWIALEPPLAVSGWIGALLIFLANVILAVRKAQRG